METIIFEKKEKIAFLRLNRPDKYNSFNKNMAHELQNKLDLCEKDDDIRVIVITGEGKAFSAGQDLSEVINDENFDISNAVANYYNPIISKIRNSKLPILAAVNGVAAGAGANIALCCDIVIASSNASFIQAFSKIGLIPDSGGTWFLPRIIGFQRASSLMMTGEKVDAHQAFTMGLIYKVFDANVFNEKCLQLALELSEMPTAGLHFTKQALNASYVNSLQDQLKLEENLQSMAGSTHDYHEGITAFIEKRPPKFIGK